MFSYLHFLSTRVEMELIGKDVWSGSKVWWLWIASKAVRFSIQATELLNIFYSILWLTHSTIDLTLPIIKMKIHKSFIFLHFQAQTWKHLWRFASLCGVHTPRKVVFGSPHPLSLEPVFLATTTWARLNTFDRFFLLTSFS